MERVIIDGYVYVRYGNFITNEWTLCGRVVFGSDGYYIEWFE